LFFALRQLFFCNLAAQQHKKALFLKARLFQRQRLAFLGLMDLMMLFAITQ
jgi:hypothetical protein